MNQGQYIFSQIADFLPKKKFDRCVDNYNGNHNMHTFSCSDQFLCMAFAQLTYRESLRDTGCCLRAMQKKLYHIGIRGKVSGSTLADANENRNWRICCDFAQILIREAGMLCANDDFGLELKQTVCAPDAPTVDLCLSVFPWARFRQSEAAVKLHTLPDLRGNIPTFISVTDGKVHDVNIPDELIPEPGSVYVMDRGYPDFGRLYRLHQNPAFFVTRKKTNTGIRRIYSAEVDKTAGLRCDQVIMLTGVYTRKYYPEKLRRVKYYDVENNKKPDFPTDNFSLPAIIIANLYKCRRQVELFFKRIKQHLRIKAFYGTSENAVKSQIWIAVSIYVPVAIIKKRLRIEQSLYTILQIPSVSIFEKMPIYQALTNTTYEYEITNINNQLNLFDN